MTVSPIEYSGHGDRIKEPLLKDWEPFLKDVSGQIRDRYEEGNAIALCGYSMGSLTAHELTVRNMLPGKPRHIFLISHSAPHISWFDKNRPFDTDEKLIRKMQALGGFAGIDEKILNSRYFQYMYMKPLAADYHLLSHYRSTGLSAPDIPASVFYSPEDESISRIGEWKQYYPDTEFWELDGNHFLLKNHCSRIAEIIRQSL